MASPWPTLASHPRVVGVEALPLRVLGPRLYLYSFPRRSLQSAGFKDQPDADSSHIYGFSSSTSLKLLIHTFSHDSVSPPGWIRSPSTGQLGFYMPQRELFITHPSASSPRNRPLTWWLNSDLGVLPDNLPPWPFCSSKCLSLVLLSDLVPAPLSPPPQSLPPPSPAPFTTAS